MNEKNQTQTVTGPRPVQRDAGQESSIKIEKEIAALEAEEALLFTARGYGGYINSELLAENRAARAALQQTGEPSAA